MFFSQYKNIFKFAAFFTLFITLVQFCYFPPAESNTGFNKKNKIIILTSFFNDVKSPANIENNFKKTTRSGISDESDYKVFSNVKALFSDCTRSDKRLKLLYELGIEDYINSFQLLTNAVGLRSPPSLTA